MIEILRRAYYRGRLTLWAIFNLPEYLHIGNTDFKIPAHNWMVAIPARIDTTEVRYFGRHRDFARYFYEPIEYEYFMEIVRGKKVFFDVGANIGWYSFIAADAGVERIVAFEFMKEYADFTSANFRRENIPGTVVNKGAGNPTEAAEYSDPLARISGELISLDEYSKANNIWPDIVKMDIEGFELDALRNAHEILLRKPALDISLHDRWLADRGQSESEVLELLSSYGYKTIWQGGGTYFMVVPDNAGN
jgi:hypothetical protein